jgi:hypothetical protein
MNHKLKLLACVVVSCSVVVGVAHASSSPTVATGATSSITTSSAQLHGTVNPNGATTTYQFQWGLTTQYGLSSPSKSARGTKVVAVKATISQLLPGTVYHYRLVASSRSGGAALGADRTFKTAGNPPPDAATGPPSQVGTSTATVSAVINPHGAKTTWAFQYGITPSYVAQTFGGSVPPGSAPVSVAQTLVGLEPGTLFHYRIVAFHGGSVIATGTDGIFYTLPSPRPVPRINAATTPHHARTKPYSFTTTGKVLGSSRFPAALECTGDATVRFVLGKRTVAFTLIPVQPNCTFSTQTTFKRLPGRGKRPKPERLRVQIGFRGNGYVAPASARLESVLLG